MSIFLNFFLRTIAFLFAITIFFILLNYFLTFKENGSAYDKNFTFKEGDVNSDNKIAILRLKGPIFTEPANLIEFDFIGNFNAIYVSEVEKDLKELELEKLKGMIILIDSPGGSVAATFKLYKSLKKFKQKNKTIIFVHTSELLASGGYWISLVGDKIYANYGALIGSIGVRGPDWIFYDEPLSISSGILGQTVETKKGIKKFNIIAGRSKDLFDSFRMPTEEEIKTLRGSVNNIYVDFVNSVSNSRNIENQFITENLGALLFDTKQAKEKYLIDDVVDLNIVQDRMIKELKLKNFKILEKKKTKTNLLKKIIQSSILLKYDVSMIRKKEVCNLVNSYISVLFVDNYLINNC